MRTRWILVAVAAGAAALVLLQGCGQAKYAPKLNEELYGTWVNTTYSGKSEPGAYLPQKEVIDSNGYSIYRFADDFAKYFVGSEQIVSKWTDSEGNIWYKTYRLGNNGEKAEVLHLPYRVGKSGAVQESEFAVMPKYSPGSFPTKIEPKDPTYRTYNRAGR